MKEKFRSFFNMLNNKKELIYLISFSIFVLFNHLSFSVLACEYAVLWVVVSVVQWIIFAEFSMLILCEIFIFKTKQFSYLFVVALVFSFITIIFTGNALVLLLLVLAMGLKNIPIEKIVKAWLISVVIMFVCFITLAILEKIPNWSYERNEFKLRYALGYSYPTPTSSFFMFITLAYVYLRKTKITYFELVSIFIVATLLYSLTDSKTGWILTTIIVIGALIFKLINNRVEISKFFTKKIVVIFFTAIPIICVAVSLLLTYLYAQNVPFAISLDKALSGRLYLQLQAFNNYSQTLFGQYIKWQGWGGYGYVVSTEGFFYNYIDNSWILTIFDHGIINAIMLTVLFSLSTYSIVKQKDFWLLYIIIFFVIDTLIESFLLSPGTCFIFILFIMAFNKDKNISFKKKNINQNKEIKESKNNEILQQN